MKNKEKTCGECGYTEKEHPVKINTFQKCKKFIPEFNSQFTSNKKNE